VLRHRWATRCCWLRHRGETRDGAAARSQAEPVARITAIRTSREAPTRVSADGLDPAPHEDGRVLHHLDRDRGVESLGRGLTSDPMWMWWCRKDARCAPGDARRPTRERGRRDPRASCPRMSAGRAWCRSPPRPIAISTSARPLSMSRETRHVWLRRVRTRDDHRRRPIGRALRLRSTTSGSTTCDGAAVPRKDLAARRSGVARRSASRRWPR
jgi:hypothetical protein